MRYLQPKFTIAVSDQKGQRRFDVDKRGMGPRPPRPGHEFLDGALPGICSECALDKIGHELKFGKGAK